MPYRVYPVCNTETLCNDYTVKVCGTPVALDTARVSRIPFNRRWPGHQREIAQSELVNFLSLATDEPITLEITPAKPFETVTLRPLSANIKHEITEGGSILVHLEHPQYFTVEPYGRNHALHVFADPMPQYDIDKNDPNVLYFGAGEHEVGCIELHSNQTLFLDEGAVVYATIKAKDASNVRILGRGILDVSHTKEQILFEAHEENNHAAVKNAKRTHTIWLEYCDNVEIDGITIRDSLVYNIRPLACRDLRIKNVKIIGCWRFNSDGIDMHNCEDVRIEHCFLRTFDDSICIKGFDCYYEGDVEAAVKAAMHRNGGNYESFRDVLVRDCVVWTDWGRSLEIGAETRAEEICDIRFEDCDIIHVMHAVLDAQNVDYADVHDVTFENIRIECDERIPKSLIQQNDAHTYVNTDPVYMPLTLCARVVFHHEYSAGGARRGKNRDLTFRNIYVVGDKMPRARFGGYNEEHKTENVLIDGLYLNGERLTELTGENWSIEEFAENIRMQ